VCGFGGDATVQISSGYNYHIPNIMQIVRDWTFQVKDGLEETLRGGRKSLTRRKINLPEDRYVEMLYEQGDVSSVSAHLSFLFETVDKWPATSIRI
jgi:hypothetical protein